MSGKNEAAIRRCLAAVFDANADVGDEPARSARRDLFIFHMTDWLQDIEDLAHFYEMQGEGGEEVNARDSGETVVGFIAHVVPHLAAAYTLIFDELPPTPFGDLRSRASESSPEPGGGSRAS